MLKFSSTWLWSSRSWPARLARFALLPPSLAYRAGMSVRNRAYAMRLLARSEADVPVVSVGNLTVGGSGKTPIASWIAGYYDGKGIQPGIVLRGYGGDEGRVHRRLVESAIVVESPDRLAGTNEAARGGAEVVILDDAFQRLDIERDLNIVLVSTESGRAAPWTLPAGPWREGFSALRRADLVIVTRKRAGEEPAVAMANRVQRLIGSKPVVRARLGVSGFRGLLSGSQYPVSTVRKRKILAAPGIADPFSLAAQCRSLGAEVRLLPFPDHVAFSAAEVTQLLHLGTRVDYVVVTEKDAVKLEGIWPDGEPEPLVAGLDVEWEDGQIELQAALDMVVFGANRHSDY